LNIALLLVLVLVLAAEFANGITDAPNAIATVVSTRVLSPMRAVAMASVLNIVGALVTGTAVAATVGKGFVKPEAIGLEAVAAAAISVIIWTTITARIGLPTSKTHEIVASLTGAGLAVGGTSVLLSSGWTKVLAGLGISIIVGFVGGYLIMISIYNLFRNSTNSAVRKLFSRLQLLSALFVAFSHGSNDGQKFMGIFTLALFLGGVVGSLQVPVWVILICGGTMGLGTMFGGWRIIRTMGFRLTHLEPVNGFAAETASGMAILASSYLGIPISTTQTVNSAIMGVGATRRLSAVRWGVTRQIVTAWLLTFPVCGLLGYILAKLFNLLGL